MKCQCGSSRSHKSTLNFYDSSTTFDGKSYSDQGEVYIDLENFRKEDMETIYSFFETINWTYKESTGMQNPRKRYKWSETEESLVWRELGINGSQDLKGYLRPALFSNNCIDCGRVAVYSELPETDKKIDHILHLIEMIKKP